MSVGTKEGNNCRLVINSAPAQKKSSKLPMSLQMLYHYQNVWESLRYLVDKTTSVATARQLAETIRARVENLKNCVILNDTRVYLVTK